MQFFSTQAWSVQPPQPPAPHPQKNAILNKCLIDKLKNFISTKGLF